MRTVYTHGDYGVAKLKDVQQKWNQGLNSKLLTELQLGLTRSFNVLTINQTRLTA